MRTGEFSQSKLRLISEATQVGEARRYAVMLAQELGFTEVEAAKVGIVVTEAANNLVKHARNGRVLFRSLEHGAQLGLEVIALDTGPGMADISKCMRDGYSTSGTTGTGLGAIQRLSTLCEIYSVPERGTVAMAQFWAKQPLVEAGPLDVGAVCVAMATEEECGDAWNIQHHSRHSTILVTDGLGHGSAAAQAANEAVRIFRENSGDGPSEIIRLAHGALRSTRGAGMAVADINFEDGTVRYAGVGNIASVIVTRGATRSLVSNNGIVGYELHRVTEFTYPWSKDSVLIMHSDGLQSRWTVEPYPGLLARHPSLVAGVLYRDYQRGRDDVTVLTVRQTDRINERGGVEVR